MKKWVDDTDSYMFGAVTIMIMLPDQSSNSILTKQVIGATVKDTGKHEFGNLF